MSRKRRADEIFTPEDTVIDMLSLLPDEAWDVDKTYLDPACGEGDILVVVLQAKLDQGHKPLVALRHVFGVDIMPDNIAVTRKRLLAMVPKGPRARKVVKRNIRVADFLLSDMNLLFDGGNHGQEIG